MKIPNLQRKLKLVLCLLMTLVISMSCVQLGAAEQVAGQATAGQQIDVVIVLDNSNSMYPSSKNANHTINDEAGYRIDAAQMFISMCDMNGSRVAVLPFAKDIWEEYQEKGFVALDSEDSRNDLIKEIETLRFGTRPDTNLGQAMSVAVEMLANRQDKTNSPMILVLTDGNNSINITGKHYTFNTPVWDEASGTFQETEKKIYATQNGSDGKAAASAYSDELCDTAVKAAAALGIPVYTVPLFEGSINDTKVKGYYDVLQRMANRTGGLCIPVNKDNVDRLPEKFGEMLAERLGSSLVVNLAPEQVEGNLYQVKLPMLNNSVMEANIYIPVVEDTAKKGIRSSQVWLYDPDDNDVSGGNGSSVTRSGSDGHFRLYKLRQPIPTGEWTLQFRVEGNVDPNNIAFSVLYNYDVSLRTFIGLTPSALTEGNDGQFGKKNTLLVQSQFYSNSTQKPAEDPMLYSQEYADSENIGEEWYTIKARYEMKNVGGRVLFSGDIPSNNVSKFEGKIDLAKAHVDDKGNSMLRSGTYELVVYVEGAGLSRETHQWVELTNSPVICTEGKEVALPDQIVDDPDNLETREPMRLEFLLDKFFDDPDSDPITYIVNADNEAETGSSWSTEEILPLKVVEKEDGWYVAGTTIKGSDGRIHYGTCRYELTVSDNEDSITFPLTVKVLNKTVSDIDNFECVVDVTGVNAQGLAQKNSDVTFSMSLKNKETGDADTSGSIDLYSCEVTIFDANNTTALLNKGPVAMEAGKDGKTLVYTYHTDDKAHAFKAVCEFFYNGESCGTQTINFEVINTKPQAVADALKDQPDQIAYQSGSFPPVLQHITTEDELTFKLGDLFKDADANEKLEYYDPVFTTTNPDINWKDIIDFEPNGDKVVLKHVGEGKVTMSITAEDGDGETAVFTKDYTLVDMTKRWTVYWAIAIAALITAVLLIRALVIALKPAYDGRVSIENYEGSALGASAVTNLPTGKKKRKKTAPLRGQVDPSLAQKYGIDIAKLDNVKIAPRKHVRDGAVDIWQDGRTDGLEITLNGEPLSKKHKVWSNGGAVVIRSLATNGSIRLVHTLESGPIFEDVAIGGGSDPFGGAGGNSFDMGGFDNSGFGGGNDSFGSGSFGGNDSFGGGNNSFGGNDSFGGGSSFGGNGNSSSGDTFGNFGDFGV
ncbi:MAG: VWA domain-containing protein [Clostridia bacterium]|nr:VWA domain-containing protein [Clostridia bacterium]